MTQSWKRGLLAAPAIGVSLLPKLACPACWPAYASLLSSVGLGILISTAYLLPLTAGFLALALGTMAFRAKSRRGYGPFLVGLLAAGAVLLAKFVWESHLAVYGGFGLLLVASAWNAWTPGNPNLEITWEKGTTSPKKKVEIFIAGCSVCDRTIDLVMRNVDSSHDVVIVDTHRPDVAYRAEKYGIRTVPAVVIDGKLAQCCAGRGCDEQVLRAALNAGS